MDRRDFLLSMAAAGLGVRALAAAQPAWATPPPATRKHWAWMRGGTSPADAFQRKLAALRAAGIGAVLIEGNAAFYESAVRITKAEGLELHAWMPTMMRAENTTAHPEWYAVSRSGNSTAAKPPYVPYYTFMCPSRDEVRDYLVGLMRGIASIDGITSVHLDYIRYPDVILPVALWPKYHLVQDKEYPDFDFCYCGVCRDRFTRATGLDPQALPDPPSNRAWLQYRYDAITRVVAEIADAVHVHKTLVTAAVFPTPTIAKTLVRQDWTHWNIDAVLPMTYHAFYKKDVPWIETATREGVTALAGRMPLYSGLYVPDLPPADLARAATCALAGGASGVSCFEANGLTADHLTALATVIAK